MIMVREEGENYDLKRRQKCKKKRVSTSNYKSHNKRDK